MMKFKKANGDNKDLEMREVDGKKEYLDEETKKQISQNELKTR